MIEGSLSLVTLLAVVAFSWGVAVLPDSANEKRVGQWIASIGADSWLSRESSKHDGHRYFRLTERLFDETMADRLFDDYPVFHRNLRLREQLLIANILAPEDQVALTDEDMKVREQALKKTIGLSLNGRDLRYADFSESVMPKVDLRKANLTNANFGNAILTSARLERTFLDSADLQHAQLQDADLRHAQAQAANLRYAQLQGADLRYTQAQAANLEYAQLQNADLLGARLQAANFENARLQNADLRQAQLQVANFEYASLQNAVLWNAQLQAANLSHANLQEAYLKGAQFQGADMQFVKLQGAPTSNSILEDSGKIEMGTKDSTTATIGEDYYNLDRLDSTIFVRHATYTFGLGELTLTNITGINFKNLLELLEGVRRLPEREQRGQMHPSIVFHPNMKKREKIEPLDIGIDPEFLDAAKQIAPEILDIVKQTAKDSKSFKPDSLNKRIDEIEENLRRLRLEFAPLRAKDPKPKRRNIWTEEPDESLRKIFEKSEGNLAFAKSKSDYDNKLMAFRIEISCQDRWVAAGIINFLHRRVMHWRLVYRLANSQPYPLPSSVVQCLLTLKNKKDKSGQPVCPGVSKINNDALRKLEETASWIEEQEFEKMASGTEPENTIQPTFKCRRMESQKPQT